MTVPFRTMAGLIDLTDLRPCHVTAPVVADALSKIARYNGRTPDPWSVATHSVLVSRLCPPEYRAWGLLHDAHEIFLGDITSPAVDLIDKHRPGVRAAIREAKAALDYRIAHAWALSGVETPNWVQQCDAVALLAEMYCFFGAEIAVAVHLSDTLDRAIALIPDLPAGADWRAARDLWIAEAHELAQCGLLRLPAETDHSTPL